MDAPGPHGMIDLVRIPRKQFSPTQAIVRRVGLALALMVFVALVVRLGRSGYEDSTGGEISFLDAIYYASVTTTTTGYGDIAAVSPLARLMATLLITPARILFLILVVGTTVEVLTDQTRMMLAARRWRNRVNNHYVICGFGATGLAAVNDLLARGISPSEIVAVDRDDAAVARASELGLVAIQGDATHNAVLEQAGIDRAKAIVVAPNRDDTAVLVTLTARELNETAHIVAGGREQENLHLLRQGGANEVIDATAAVGRMLGLATHAPSTVRLLDDLMIAGDGLELVEVSPTDDLEVPTSCTLVGVVRGGRRLPPAEMDATDLKGRDRLIVVRESK